MSEHEEISLGADEQLLRRCSLLLASEGPRPREELERRLVLALAFGEVREREVCEQACNEIVGKLIAEGSFFEADDALLSLSEAGQGALFSSLRNAEEQNSALPGHARTALSEVVDVPQARMFADRIASLLRVLHRMKGRRETAGEARMLSEIVRSRLRHWLDAAPERRVNRVRDIIDFFYSQTVVLENRKRNKGCPRHIRKEHVRWQTVRKGVASARVEMSLRNGPILAHLLRIDLHKMSLRAVDATGLPADRRTLSSIMKPYNAFEGTSGGFFLYSETDIEPPSRRGDPVGLLVRDGEVRCPPLFNRAALLLDDKGHVHVRRVGLRGTTLEWEGGRVLLRTVNRPRQSPADIIGYSRAFGPKTPARCGRTVTVVSGRVTAFGQGETEIPLLGLVVALPEDRIADELYSTLKSAKRVRFQVASQHGEGLITQAMAGGPMLVDEGRVVIDMAAEDFLPGVPPVTFSDDATQGSNLLPRLAWGILPDHRVVALAVDGRNVDRSVGESLDGMARTMLSLGCVMALNYDGGSSKRMAVGGQVVDISGTALVEGRGSHGPQRPLSSAWVVVSR